MAVGVPKPEYDMTLTCLRVSKLEFVQRFFWHNAGFNSLRTLEKLNMYTERWDVSLYSL
jgi:hypothetical protein